MVNYISMKNQFICINALQTRQQKHLENLMLQNLGSTKMKAAIKG